MMNGRLLAFGKQWTGISAIKSILAITLQSLPSNIECTGLQWIRSRCWSNGREWLYYSAPAIKVALIGSRDCSSYVAVGPPYIQIHLICNYPLSTAARSRTADCVVNKWLYLLSVEICIDSHVTLNGGTTIIPWISYRPNTALCIRMDGWMERRMDGWICSRYLCQA